ncbi:unnamed protein product, partial [Meganyctiphanes norvegica]
MSLKESALIFATTVFMCYVFLYSNLARMENPNPQNSAHSQLKAQITITKMDTNPKLDEHNSIDEASFLNEDQEILDYFEEESESNKKFNKMKTQFQNKTYSLLNSLMKSMLSSVNNDNEIIAQRIQRIKDNDIKNEEKSTNSYINFKNDLKKQGSLENTLYDDKNLKATNKIEKESEISTKSIKDTKNGLLAQTSNVTNIHQVDLYNSTNQVPTLPSTSLSIPASTTSTHNGNQQTMLQFASVLPAPVLVVPPSRAVLYNDTWHGYTKPILAIAQVGRLGNTMGSYASLHAIGKVYNSNVFMLPEVVNALKPIFPHLTMSPLPVPFVGGSWKYVGQGANITDYTGVQEAAAGLQGPRTLLVDDYPFEMQIFNAYWKDILKEFTFNKNLLTQAEIFLQKAGSLGNQTKAEEPTFIGVHIRRTDYLQVLPRVFGATLPGKAYLHRALNFYRTQLKNPIFIVASDDMDYAQDIMSREADVVMAPGSSADFDLCLLSLCRHSVMTVGSYSFWASYLAGGTVLYPNLKPNLKPFIFTKQFFQKAGLNNFLPLEP